MSGHRDELEADFQQFYNLDLSRMGTDFTVAHAAVLASQLPRGSRALRALNPDLEWSDEMGVLVRIDYLLQILLHALGGKKGGDKPKPLETPSERLKKQDKFAHIENEMDEIAKTLGIGG